MKRRVAVVLVAVIALVGCGSKPQSAAYKKCVRLMSGQGLVADHSTAAPVVVSRWNGSSKQERQRLIAACLRNPDPTG